MDGENSSPEGGPDTPPNTPVTPSHKTSKEHHKLWRDSDKTELEPAASLGQHHQRQRHSHHSPFHIDSQYHFPYTEKKLSSSSHGACEVRTPNETSSTYSCYHTHWCAASSPSTPTPIPTPTSPSPSPSSENSGDWDAASPHPFHHRLADKFHRSPSGCKSIADGDDDDDDRQDEKHEQDHSGNLPNPGTQSPSPPRQPIYRPDLFFSVLPNVPQTCLLFLHPLALCAPSLHFYQSRVVLDLAVFVIITATVHPLGPYQGCFRYAVIMVVALIV